MERIHAAEFNQHAGRVIDRTLHSGPLAITVHGYAACVLAHPSQISVEVPIAATISATDLFRHTGQYLEDVRGGACIAVTRHGRTVVLMLPVGLAYDLLGVEDPWTSD